jgi:TPR repeat protein
MRFDSRSLRWLLPVLFILSTATQMAAQNTKQLPAGYIATLIKQAESGDAKAQFELGVMYRFGQSVSKDEVEAARWFRKAAEQKNALAQFNLGVAYTNGEGVPKNEAEAVRWYRKAAEQGNAEAQHSLGVAYVNGEGVPKNENEAYFWLTLEASALDEKVRSARDQVGEKLTPEKRLEIQERCRKWAETHPPNRN